MIARNADAVELGHVFRGVFDDVGNDPHAWRRRVDIGVADHEFLENVVLDGAVELVLRDAGFFGGDDVEGEAGQDGAVHRHRHAHLVERDAIEQDLHVLDRIDRHAGLADIARHARMVAVIAAMGGEIESDAQPLLSGGKVAAVKGVRGFGGRKTGVLADRPRAAGIHAGAHAAREGRKARQAGIGGHIGGGIERLDGDAFGGRPGQVGTLDLLGGHFLPVSVRRLGHVCLPDSRISAAGGGASITDMATWAAFDCCSRAAPQRQPMAR